MAVFVKRVRVNFEKLPKIIIHENSGSNPFSEGKKGFTKKDIQSQRRAAESCETDNSQKNDSYIENCV